jgi:hypothetical protein
MNYKEPRTERRKKADKAREKYERTGGLGQKHVRIAVAVAAAAAAAAAAPCGAKKMNAKTKT